jgi:GLPGLI family protein
MKRIILFLAALLPIALFAQQTEGEITYMETIKMQLDFGDGPEAEEMKKMIPPTQSFPKTLFFNANESLYQDKQGTEEEGDVEMSGSSGGGDFQIKMMRPDNKLYRNIAEGTTLESREFFGRYFLIADKAKMPAWKITSEQKKLLGYVCMKATVQLDSATNLVAWFSPQIPVSTGPSIHAGLPGLILEMAMNGDQRTIVASQIDLKALPKGSLEKPSKGKEVTAEEFKKIEAEKMKEMNMEMGGGAPGTMRMIIRN